jgi:hypothetical protein
VQSRVPYCCNTWRCAGCRRHEAAVTFARIKQATDPLPADGWVFLVLTLDRAGYYSGQPWSDVNAAYRALGTMSRAVLGRIGRTWGPETKLERSGRSKTLRTVRALGNRWVSVIEAHRSGWPHCNLLVWCPELADELRREHADRLADADLADAVALARDAWRNKEPITRAMHERARAAVVLSGPLLGMATASGWGRESTAEAAHSADAIAGYIVKMAGHHDAATGELAKITQAPLNAPERFRRLRSGKGFLPPRRSNPEVTGCLVRRRRAAAGDWEICAVNAPKDPLQHDAVERACNAELQLIDEEEQILSRQRGQLPVMPPVRLALHGKLEAHQDTSERRRTLLKPPVPASPQPRGLQRGLSKPSQGGDSVQQPPPTLARPRAAPLCVVELKPCREAPIDTQPPELARSATAVRSRAAPLPSHRASTTAGSGMRSSRAALTMRRATVSRTGRD